MKQISSLINLSEKCTQTISNNCTGNPLSQSSWWIDRNGQRRDYWHGDHETGTEGCYCSLEGFGCLENSFGESVSIFYYTV